MTDVEERNKLDNLFAQKYEMVNLYRDMSKTLEILGAPKDDNKLSVNDAF